MLKITAPRLVKNLREDVDWMDCISRQKDDFTECSFNGLCVEDVSKQNLSVNSCLFTNCGFIACNYRKSQFSDVVFKNCEAEFHRTSLKGIDLTSSEIAGIRIGSIPGGELKGATVTSLQALDIARMLGITIKD